MRFHEVVSICAVLLSFSGCDTVWRARFIRPERLVEACSKDGKGKAKACKEARKAPVIKCHMRSTGQVYVLGEWKLDQKRGVITGKGILYDAYRKVVSRGPMIVPLKEIALLETNRPYTISSVSGGALAVFGVLTAGTVAMTAFCIAHPKACWGSCPTFYASNGRRYTLQAEGFSKSVAKVLESTDIDALYFARPEGRRFSLFMTNEALETHVVKSVSVLAVPRNPGERVFRAGNTYLPARRLTAPSACTWEGGSCLEKMLAADMKEHVSPADLKDLAAKEIVSLVFPGPSSSEARLAAKKTRLGIVLVARNTLLNTFLFYELLSYMGRRAGEWWTKLETGGPRYAKIVKATTRLLGDVEVFVLLRSGWTRAGAFSEVGPIAREVQLVVLPGNVPSGPLRIRLRLTRGNWKLDHAALAEIGPERKAQELLPVGVDHKGRPDPVALKRLLDPNRYLITLPRDVYRIRFELPDKPDSSAGRSYELFLKSRGYYYEWIRKELTGKEDDAALMAFFLDPASTLRRLAPRYKQVERRMDRIFWNSRLKLPDMEAWVRP